MSVVAEKTKGALMVEMEVRSLKWVKLASRLERWP